MVVHYWLESSVVHIIRYVDLKTRTVTIIVGVREGVIK